MNLQDVSNAIEVLYPDLITQKELYNNFMNQYSKRKAEIVMMDETMGYKNAEMREAYVTSCLETEGLNKKKQEISNNYYRIKLELDFLQELSSNLRAIAYEGR